MFMYIYGQIILHYTINTVCASYKQDGNSPTCVCVGIPLFIDFVFYGKTDLGWGLQFPTAVQLNTVVLRLVRLGPV